MLEALGHIVRSFFSETPLLPLAGSFSEVQESFLGSTDGATVLRWALVAGGIFLLFFVISMFRYLSDRKHSFIPSGWITSPRVLRSLLVNALNQRSSFDMQFADRAGQRRPTLRCSFRDLQKDRLALEAQGVKSVVRRWTGREVTCYFKISIRDQAVYYTFNSRIIDVELKAMGFSLIWLAIPEKLQNRQKRAFLRINPPEEYLLGAALWHGRRLPAPEMMGDVRLWEKPNLALLPGRLRQFEITDISAGGLRLTIPRKELIASGTEFNVSEKLILLIDFLDPEVNKRARFWLLCRVQNLANEYNMRTIEMGLRFLAWAMPGEGSGDIEWLRLTRENEVAPLGNWIIRRHLELLRANPEEDELRI